MDFLAIDVETTGEDPAVDKVCELGWAITASTRANCGRRCHGITCNGCPAIPRAATRTPFSQ